MKNTSTWLVAIAIVAILGACDKDGARPTRVINEKSKSINQQLLGKWYVVKDSVRTFDGNTVIPNIVQPAVFSKSDFIVFGKDTATVSSAAAFNALYTAYETNQADSSKLTVNTTVVPNLTFKYRFEGDGYERYALIAENIIQRVNTGYIVSAPDTTSLVLEHEDVLPSFKHDYRIKEYLYLKNNL